MERIVLNKLIEWKNSPRRKPLILNGARQVGKTWLLHELAHREYAKEAYIYCRKNEIARRIFTQDFDTERILISLRALTGVDITPGDTLIVLDEVQDIPEAIESLKYFYENAPQYHIAVAGSLLGISMHSGVSFPVGKVDEVNIHPMNFDEFLLAKGEEEMYKLLISKQFDIMTAMHEKYIGLLRQYLFVGGMPEAVAAYIDKASQKEIRTIQSNILAAYFKDISKHAPKNEIQRIELVINNIPSQLAKENKKFIFGALKPGGRAREFEVAIRWLQDCGIVHKVCRVNKPEMPLSFYGDTNAFKLYFCDCGLLGALMKTPVSQIIADDSIFSEYKGAFTENFVLQQLKANSDLDIYYYSNEKSTLEIDFLLQQDGKIIPVEVKAEENLKSKSLKSFVAKHPGTHGIRFSMSGYMEHDWLTNVPLYGVGEWF